MSWPQDIEWNLKKNRFWLKRMWLWLASALYFLIQGLFRYLYDCTTFGTNRYIENWSFFLKWGLDDAHTTSRSWDMKLAFFFGIFGRFWAVFAISCILCYSNPFETDKLQRKVIFLLKMRPEPFSYDKPFLRYEIGFIFGIFGRF